MVVHACNSSIWEVEAGGLEGQGHPRLHGMLEISLCYTGPCLQTHTKSIQPNKHMENTGRLRSKVSSQAAYPSLTRVCAL